MPAGPTPDLPDLARQALAAPDRKRQTAALARLARRAHRSPDVMRVFQTLLAPPGGPRPALEYVARMPLPIPNGVVLLAAPVLADRRALTAVRLAAAARLVATLPDQPASIGPVLRALTAGLSRGRTLDRLTQLQNRLEKSDALDAEVAALEARVRLRCPKCPARLSRSELAKHLWRQHRLVFEGGKAREPAPLVERAVADYLANGRPGGLDHVYHLADTLYAGVDPTQVYQAVLSRTGPTGDDLQPLARAAAEGGAGLCPACYAAIRNPVATLPPPLPLAEGRLVGEGYRVDAGPRTLTIRRPGFNPESTADPRARYEPRDFGARVGAAVAGVGALAAALVPRAYANPFAPAFLLSVAGVLAYAAARFTRGSGSDPDARAVDGAWAELVPQVGRSVPAVRFLTRLCRTSLGVGTVALREETLRELVEHAAVLAEKGGAYVQLLAAVRLLETHDAARRGSDWGAGLADLFDPFLRGELPAEYAEAAAECLAAAEPFTDREAARLRVTLAGTAFEAGLTPADLVELGRFLPQFARLLAGTDEWYRLLYHVWRLRGSRPWEGVAGAGDTAFEFARKSPAGSGKVLVGYPDTLVVGSFGPPFDRELGLILVGRRGVTVMERTVADPDAPVTVGRTRGGTSVLQFGPHAIPVRRRLTEKVSRILSGWLRVRAERIMPAADRADAPVSERVRQILLRQAVECPVCHTRSVLRTGAVGARVS
jgi:hypothetical protein